MLIIIIIIWGPLVSLTSASNFLTLTPASVSSRKVRGQSSGTGWDYYIPCVASCPLPLGESHSKPMCCHGDREKPPDSWFHSSAKSSRVIHQWGEWDELQTSHDTVTAGVKGHRTRREEERGGGADDITGSWCHMLQCILGGESIGCRQSEPDRVKALKHTTTLSVIITQ